MRNQELYEKNLISAEQFENSKFEFVSQKAAYELAYLNLEYSAIRAPISGSISQRIVKAGSMGQHRPAKRSKITVFDPSLAVLHVPEHEMSKLIKNHNEHSVEVDAIHNQTFTGKVLRISPVVNPETGTFKVTVAIDG
ncbi:MAG: efflux RND transporter periplasmic adaptor subunit [Balneolaceae bacterium]|nr:efflux RND transporter periplasmic adaptor subunit [Balneolaceae bacterium]